MSRSRYGDLQVPKAVIFDVDGTLVDSVDLHARSWQQAFLEFDHDIPFRDIRSQIGKGGDQLIPVFLNEDECARMAERLESRRSALFKADYLPRVKPFPKVRSLFLRLRKDGRRIVLASSAKPDELAAYKQIACIDDLIETETGAADVERSKPHPDIFQAALQRLPAAERDTAVVVGDTPYDAEAAAKAGLKTIGVLSGGFAEQDLRSAGCIAIYRDVADLLQNYESSPLV
jgi:HAD superfamily hydrolase (TIGR01549 family)